MNRSNLVALSYRKSTAETRAGQYMCPKCGKVVDTKKEVDAHIRSKHKTKLEWVTDNFFAE